MVAENSTSYPTLAVIQHHGLTGEAARLVWAMSDVLGTSYWRHAHAPAEFDEGAEALADLAPRLRDLIGAEAAGEALNHLWRNVARAVAWCRENANG